MGLTFFLDWGFALVHFLLSCEVGDTYVTGLCIGSGARAVCLAV